METGSEVARGGDFVFDHPLGLKITRGLDEAEVAAVCGKPPQVLGNGFIWHHLPETAVEDGMLAAALCFYEGALLTVSLRVSDPEKADAPFSEAEESACVRRTQKWLRVLGHKPGNHRWYEIRVGYDLLSGSGGAVVSIHQ